MLEQLRLSNFRSFDREATIRFRPITVLIGSNNAGKSSVIKFLLMLQQSLSLDSPSFLAPSGEKVRLGPFSEIGNVRSRKRNLSFRLRAIDPGRPGDALALYPEALRLGAGQPLRYTIDVSVARGKAGALRGKSSMSALLGDDALFTLSAPVTERSRFMDFADVRQRRRSGRLRSGQEQAEQYCLAALARQFSLLHHIGPVRADIPRAFDTGEPTAANCVGSAGQNALRLLKDIRASRSRYRFFLSHLSRVLDIGGIAFNERGELAQCIAKNNATGARTNLADLGFGVSQCLPIFVQGAVMDPYSTMMIEQPEARMHPTAQLELAAFFADLWAQRNVCSIIETHSGNILLRLRSLVTLGPEQGGLSPADVSIAYFDIRDGQTVVRNLAIDENGTMEDGLPLEFFGADIEEGFRLGAAKHHRRRNHAARTRR